MNTEAQKRARKKWETKFETITFRVPKGKKEVVEKYAKNNGLSISKFLNNLIDEKINTK